MTLHVSCPEGHCVAVAADKLGRTVVCSCCYAVFRADIDFSASRLARKEEKKARRSRDDDDDEEEEEEEEKPRKKKPKPKAEEPKKKDRKPAGKTARKKDEDDEEEDEDEKEEEEPEIDWTPRKRELNLCIIGLYITMGAFGILILFTAALCVGVDWIVYEIIGKFQNQVPMDRIVTGPAYAELAGYIIGPFIALTQVVLIVALFVNLAAPAKAETRSLAIAGLVFGFIFFVFGILVLLAVFTKIVVEDEIRAQNMARLMGGAAGLCFIISLMSTMAFQSKLMMFMNMKLEASQAVTNAGFYFVYLVGMFAAQYFSLIVCNYLHFYVGFANILVIFAAAGMAIRMLIAQIMLMIKVQKTIQTYIREAM